MSDERRPDTPDDANRTVFVAPGTRRERPIPRPRRGACQPAAARPAATGDVSAGDRLRRRPLAAAPTGVGPGVVLNNIYEVKRFLARGGMGEVYEGVNVNTDERVAIKVMLPALAADPNVRAMFLREASDADATLQHPAVVNYPCWLQDPQLNVYYIVTEFIDGAPLSDMLAQLDPSPSRSSGLTRRLAEGLGAAHAAA